MKKRPFTRANRWLLVWVNGTQNSGLVNFVPESRLPFVKISSIYQKTTAKAWTRYQRWLWRNTNFRTLEYSVQKNRTTFSDFLSLHCYRTFSGGMTQKVVCHLLSNLIFRKILVHGKQQVISITITWQKTKHTKGCRVQHEDFFLLVRAWKDFYFVLVQRNLLHFNSTSTKLTISNLKLNQKIKTNLAHLSDQHNKFESVRRKWSSNLLVSK